MEIFKVIYQPVYFYLLWPGFKQLLFCLVKFVVRLCKHLEFIRCFSPSLGWTHIWHVTPDYRDIVKGNCAFIGKGDLTA